LGYQPKPTLKVGGAGQIFFDLTLIAKEFPGMVHHLNHDSMNITDQI
jgi:hypothetical protein